MPRPTKRSALRSLAKPRLESLVEQFGVDISRHSAAAKLIDALARARTVSLPALLEQLSRDELKQICRDHQIDDGGRAKEPIVARLLDPPTAAGTDRIAGEIARIDAAENQLSLLDRPAAKLEPRPVSASLPTPTPAAAEQPRSFKSFSEIASFIWSVADLLRGDYKAHEYGQVILPFTVLRRLDQVLAPTREAVWKADKTYADKPEAVRERFLQRASNNAGFYNTSPFDFTHTWPASPITSIRGDAGSMRS